MAFGGRATKARAMPIRFLPEGWGCLADSVVELTLQKELVRSIPTMNPGQWPIMRLRERNSERQVTDTVGENADPRWLSWELHTLAPGQTEESYLRRRYGTHMLSEDCSGFSMVSRTHSRADFPV